MKLICLNRKIKVSAVRNRMDVIKIVIKACEFIIDEQYSIFEHIRDVKDKSFIYMDKMKRIVISTENQLFSIGFPFNVDIDNVKITYLNNTITINNHILSVIESIINVLDERCSIEEILEKIWEEEGFEQASDAEKYAICTLITVLLSYEVGYIRYDYDDVHENGKLHPLNHFDVNYSTNTTYKIGANKKLDIELFLKLLDITSECLYLH